MAAVVAVILTSCVYDYKHNMAIALAVAVIMAVAMAVTLIIMMIKAVTY